MSESRDGDGGAGGVWVATNTSGTADAASVYHTDPDCQYLGQAERVRQFPPGQTPLRGDPCKVCTDGGDDEV